MARLEPTAGEPPPGDHVARRGPVAECFAAAVAALIGRPFAPGDSLAVAVSGGADSLALLALAHAAFGARVRVLTVDHGLRTGSGDEAAMVASIAATLGLVHATLAWPGPRPAGNLQAAARTARYALMQDWCARHGTAWLATAHQIDDQAETLLLRLARGAGGAGLAGIRPRRDLGGGVTLLRPLLGWRRADLAAITTAADWSAVVDPANADPRFDRTQARALLGAAPWLDPARLAASAAHLADGEQALDWTVELAWNSRATASDGGMTIDAAGLPHALQHRLLRRGLATLAPAAVPSGPALDRLLGRLAAGGAGTLAGIRVRAGTAGDPSVWRLTRAASRRSG